MPDGELDSTTPATWPIGPDGAAEDAPVTRFLEADSLTKGQNVLAAEIHQSGPTSSDLSFQLELLAVPDMRKILLNLDLDSPLEPGGEQFPIPASIRIEILRQRGKLKEALAVVDEELGAELPPTAIAYHHFARGRLLLGLGRDEEALTAYDTAAGTAKEMEQFREQILYQKRGERVRQKLDRP